MTIFDKIIVQGDICKIFYGFGRGIGLHTLNPIKPFFYGN